MAGVPENQRQEYDNICKFEQAFQNTNRLNNEKENMIQKSEHLPKWYKDMIPPSRANILNLLNSPAENGYINDYSTPTQTKLRLY